MADPAESTGVDIYKAGSLGFEILNGDTGCAGRYEFSRGSWALESKSWTFVSGRLDCHFGQSPAVAWIHYCEFVLAA